jgi:hypothetical protein
MKNLLFIFLLFISSCTSEPEFATKVGYFKDANKGRAFTYILPDKYTTTQISAHAKKQMHTPGKMTTVFYYSSSDKALDPTQYKTSLYEVIKTLSTSGYKFRVDKTPDGEVTLYEK